MLNVSKQTAYIILAISIVIEIIGDAMLTACHGYDNKLLGIGAILTILFSFFLFSKVLHIIDLPIAYATWSVVGALVCTLLGVFFFHQHLSTIGWISMIVLAAATFTMNMWGTPAESAEGADKPDSDGSIDSTDTPNNDGSIDGTNDTERKSSIDGTNDTDRKSSIDSTDNTGKRGE